MADRQPKRPVDKPFRFLWAAGGALALFFLLLVLLPHALEYGVEWWLARSGSTAAGVEDVDFNPFTGRLVLHDLRSDGEGGTLRCSRAALHIDWWPLWQKRARVRAVEVDGGELDLRRGVDGSWSVGGLLFPATEAEGEARAGGASWAWGVEELGLRDLTVRYSDPAGFGEVTIERVTLRELATWDPQGESPFALRLLLGGGDIAAEGTMSPLGEGRTVHADFTIGRLPLALAGPFLAGRGIEGLGGALQGKGTVDASLDAAGLRLEASGRLQAEGLRGSLPQLRVHDGALFWDGQVRLRPGDEGSHLTATGTVAAVGIDLEAASLRIGGERLEVVGALDAGAAPLFRGDGTARALTIDDLGSKRRLLHLDELALKEVSLSGFEAAAGGEIRLAGVRALERTPGEDGSPYILALEQGLLAGAQLRGPKRLELDRLRLEGAGLWVERAPDGAFEWARREDTGASQEEPAEPEPFTVGIKEAAIGGKSRLTFRDRTVSPPFEETLKDLELSLKGLDTEKKEGVASLDFKAGIGAYATLTVEGTATPMAERPTMTLSGNLEGFDLPPLNPYAASLLDYRIKSGQLDSHIDWRAKGGILDSEVQVTLAKLDLEPLKREGDRFSDMLGMPVNTALSLLRDSKDNIRLRLPVKGDIRDPSFSFNDIVLTATRTAIQRAAVSYYAPLGVTLLTGVILPPGTLFVAGKVVDWATTLRFRPLEFAPLQSALSPEHAAYLGQMAALIRDRPESQVLLCGRTVAADLRALRGERPGAEPSEEERGTLFELARTRATAVKEHLVGEGVDAGRLLICDPEVDASEEGSPRVEMAI